MIRDWSPNKVLSGLKGDKAVGSFANNIRKWFKVTSGFGQRGTIVVIFCGDEDVVAVRRLGFNTIWIAYPEGDGFNFVAMGSPECPLNEQEQSQIKSNVVGFIVGSGVDGADPNSFQNYASPGRLIGKAIP